MLRFLYDIGFLFFSIFYLPFFFIKRKHTKGFSERFGIIPDPVRQKLSGKRVIWIHAVSVGEMSQAVRVADALRKRLPDAQFVMTATTATGREIAEKFKRSEDVVLYYPVDFRASVSAFIRAVSPKAVIILETEIWPNLLAELSAKKIPVFVMNGRISDRAFPKYRMAKFFIKPTLQYFTWIGAQDERMRERFLELGALPEKVEVTGNMKYDWAPPVLKENEAEKIEKSLKVPGFIWCVAGSTHEGEEEVLFDVYKALKNKHPFFRLLIAPRHLDRLASIEAQAFRRDLKLQKVSSLLKSGEREVKEDVVFILDKMGVLANLYSLADFVFVGGSLVPYGGHNLIEPAFFEKPIVVGHFTDNFKEMTAEFKRSEAVVEVQDKEVLQDIFGKLIGDAGYRQKLGAAAKRQIALHQGATERNIQTVIKNLSQ